MEKTSLINWWQTRALKKYVIAMLLLHIPALLIFLPQCFSWSGVLLFFVFYWISGGLGITLCYHRLLTHKSFKTYKWVERILTIFGCLPSQGPPRTWVGSHRIHHKYSDKEGDPHSPKEGFSWAHMLWVVSKAQTELEIDKHTRDLSKDPFMVWLDTYWWLPQVVLTIILIVVGYLVGGPMLALSWFVWGIAARTVAVYHATWFVNSATHMWGYQNFTNTDDDSRNLWWVALLSFGEGWHNNHHAQERSAAHGMKPFEFDVTYQTIRIMKFFGIAWDVVLPKLPK